MVSLRRYRCHSNSTSTGSQSSEIQVPLTHVSTIASSRLFTATRITCSLRERMNPSIVLPSAYLMVILTTSNVMVIIACIQAHRALSGNPAQVLGVPRLYQELSLVRHAVNFGYELGRKVGGTYNGPGLWRGHRSNPRGRYVGIAVAILGTSWPATSLGISRLPGLRPPMCQGLDKQGVGQWKGNRQLDELGRVRRLRSAVQPGSELGLRFPGFVGAFCLPRVLVRVLALVTAPKSIVCGVYCRTQ